MEDFMHTYTQALARTRKRIEETKPALIAKLRSMGVESVEMTYDGENDSGQIEPPIAYDSNKQTVDLNRPWCPPLDVDTSRQDDCILASSLTDFAWDLLAVHHDGFEINDGGYGTIVVHVEDSLVTIDHNARFTDFVNTVVAY